MNVNPYHSERVNQNLLDNWYFGNPVNQRGQTEYTNIGYTIDRWRTAYGDSPTITINNGLTINGTLYQPFEKYRVIEGQNYTISALLADNTLVSATGVATWHDTWTAIVNVTVRSFTFRLVAGQTGGYWSADIMGAGETVIAVKVEQGYRQTLAHLSGGKWVLNEIPDFAQELVKCQRYYCYPDVPFKAIKAVLNNYELCSVQFPVEMRIKPTVTIHATDSSKMPGALSDWASSVVVKNGVYANPGSLTKTGLQAIFIPDNPPEDADRLYTFFVEASADL